MFKSLSVLAIAAVMTIGVPSQGNKEASPNPQKTKHDQPAVVSENREQAQSQSGDDKAKCDDVPQGRNTTVERAKVWWRDFNWWLVGIGLFTGGVICWQSIETRRAANGSKKAAEAAYMQAKHMIASERAWLAISFVSQEDKFVPRNGIAELFWEAKNVGNTPARLLESEARFQVMGDEELSEIPDYPKATPLNERVLVPGDSIRFVTRWEERKDGAYRRFELPPDSDNILLINGFAYVRYLNVFGEVCETRSCDSTWVNTRQFRGAFSPNIDAPAAYNRCT